MYFITPPMKLGKFNFLFGFNLSEDEIRFFLRIASKIMLDF